MGWYLSVPDGLTRYNKRLRQAWRYGQRDIRSSCCPAHVRKPVMPEACLLHVCDHKIGCDEIQYEICSEAVLKLWKSWRPCSSGPINVIFTWSRPAIAPSAEAVPYLLHSAAI
jgi:hypothetical protein